MDFPDHLLVYSSTRTSNTCQRVLEVQIKVEQEMMTANGEAIQASVHAKKSAGKCAEFAAIRAR